MKRRIRFTFVARDDLQRLFQFIAYKNPVAARALKASLEKVIYQLSEQPFLGRPSEEENIRRLVIGPYIALYKVYPDNVEIVHVFHGAENWQKDI
jgi:toxin ParE1/3/4